MNALNRLQRAFAEDLWGSDLKHLHGLIPDGRLPAARLLQVYRNNFRISLTEALEAVYPVMQRLVGADFFRYLADRYLRNHPPTHGDLAQFGDRMAVFVASFQPAASLPYLADIARLEWACHEVFHAPGNTPVGLDVLTRMPAADLPGLRFRLGPACHLVASDFPVHCIWQNNQAEVDEPEVVDLNRGGETVLVLRPCWTVQLWALQPAAGRLLTSLCRGEPLGEAVDQALMLDRTLDLQSLLSRYLAAGVLIPRCDSPHS
ncbi:MAG: putative DNA-binding domain-containing protein [Oceanospirillaceae bacterium]|nr:putative DNA-binding domain-containing protein [Oceanospirillaceae bacterium]